MGKVDRQRRVRATERLEEAVVALFNAAEQFSLTGTTFWDLRNRRRELLRSARAYGNAVNRLHRV